MLQPIFYIGGKNEMSKNVKEFSVRLWVFLWESLNNMAYWIERKKLKYE